VSDPPSQLGYAPTPLKWKRRRFLTWVIAFGVTAVLLPLGVRTSRLVYERFVMNKLVAACCVHRSSRAAYSDGGATTPPAEWAELNHLLGTPLASSGTIFLHERRAKDGRSLLVGVDLAQIRREQPLVVNVAVRVIARGGPLRPPRTVALRVVAVALDATAGNLTMQAGRPDPADASHFTIEYTVADRANVIDGWLLDGGEVKLEPR
jgi:hypothetical protein